MGCDFPLKAYRTEAIGESGKRGMTFNPLKAVNSSNAIEVPCGRCTGCRLERSRQWAVRMMHEAQLYDRNSFLTLTFSDENLPRDGSISVRDWQLFMKRLRKSFPQRLRFYACGEYGDDNFRPHYHAIVFNLHFTDQQHFKTTNGNPVYISSTLSRLWPYGHATTAAVTFESAAYVSRYAMKKIGGDKAAAHYHRPHPVSGVFYDVRPEFAVMSRRPGIGSAWLSQFKSDVFPSGFIVANGKRMPPPRYYTNQFTEAERELLVRQARRLSLPYKPHRTTERRRVRAAVRDARISRLKREL